MFLTISGKFSETKVYLDDVDYHLVKDYTWWINKKGTYYQVYTQIARETIILSRFLLGVTDKEIVVDHIDRNPLNNCRSNLRTATRAQNSYNTGIKISNTSGAVGVDYRKDRKKWRATIRVGGIKLSLGHFNSLQEAEEFRNLVAAEWFGNWCPVYFNPFTGEKNK